MGREIPWNIVKLVKLAKVNGQEEGENPTKQDVVAISLDAYAGQSHAQQVQKLFGEWTTVCSYSVQDGSIEHIPRRYDLYMATTDAFDSLGDPHQYVPTDGEMMEIHVTPRWDVVCRLQSLPVDKRALFVNLSDKMCREAMTRLNQLGVNQLVLDLYHPGASEPDMGQYDSVVIPREIRYVPVGTKEIIDVGQRVCDSSTIIEAALRLGLEELLESERSEQYQREVATNTCGLDRVFARSLRLESQLEMLMEILDEGIVGVNERGEAFACNRKPEEITGIPCDEVLHRPTGAVYPFLPFAHCLKGRAPQPARMVSTGGISTNVAVAPVLRGDACTGAFAMVQRFNDAENRQNEPRSQFLHKGYRAKYIFDNVVGRFPALLQCIIILKRMSLTPLSVFLIGETGTGKELSAHVVYNVSPRAGGAFVAINCAAMPENLPGSELFGYEEGAFTGARKGGKPGLFELVHGGTLFLSEVEGMSTALQCKLLRALQEWEIIRVGGNRIISVDAHIVAATNEDLERRVEEGSFRRDLYHRPNALSVPIPPLRKREGDLLLLIDHLCRNIGASLTLSPELERFLLAHQWRGNTRELHNVVEYFSYLGHTMVRVEELPPTFHYLPVAAPPTELSALAGCPREDSCFVLERLYEADQAGRSLGREAILVAVRETGLPCSQQEVRRILAGLDWAGLVRVSRGRGGTRLIPAGQALCRRQAVEDEAEMVWPI